MPPLIASLAVPFRCSLPSFLYGALRERAALTLRHVSSRSRFYQIKTGHCLTGQYLNWMKGRATPQCWWCRYPYQTREHLFKECPEWKAQQKILWAEVRKETGRSKERWKSLQRAATARTADRKRTVHNLAMI